jgi:hypothetical protein
VRQATCAVKNLILAMNGEKPIAQVNPEVGYCTEANPPKIWPKSAKMADLIADEHKDSR